MTDENELIKKRLLELARAAERGAYYTYTHFLGLAEQSALSEISQKIPVKYSVFGGSEGAERIIVAFGDQSELGYMPTYPITCIKAEPKSAKFADKLTHRDFLGAILNLGIERYTLGDIIIRDNIGYIFALSDIAPYIIDSLSTVKHTDMKLSICDEPPTDELYRTEYRRVQAKGERLDAVIAKLFSISREESLKLFAKGLVFVEGREVKNNSYIPKENERISVRGYGRFVYLGYISTTKKGSLNIDLKLYV